MKYLIVWGSREAGTIERDENGWTIECTDKILIDWNELVFQEFEKSRIFGQLKDDGFTIEQSHETRTD